MQQSLEPISHQKLRQAVEKAAADGNGHLVVELLSVRSPLSGFGNRTVAGLEVLSGGFGAGISSSSRQTFAAFCLKNDEPEVLRTVLASDLASPDMLLSLACTRRRTEVTSPARRASRRVSLGIKPSKTLTTSHQSIWDASFALNNSLGIGIGLEFDSGNARLTQCAKPSSLDAGDTLHARALGLTLRYLGDRNFWRVKGALSICRAFVTARTPVARPSAGNYILDAFVTTNVQEEFQEEFEALFDMYAQAGYFEPARRLTGFASHKHCANLLPLTGAVLLRNRVVALGLIALGADAMAVGADVGKPKLGVVDVVRVVDIPSKHARQAQQLTEEAELFAAELAAAVMERAIAQASVTAKTPGESSPRHRVRAAV